MLYCVYFLVVMLALVHWKIAEARHSVNISQYIIFTLITHTIFRLLSDVFVSGLARNSVSVFGVAATRFFYISVEYATPIAPQHFLSHLDTFHYGPNLFSAAAAQGFT
jgi:hypothetical protein